MVASDHRSTPSEAGSILGVPSSSTTNIKVIARFRPHSNDELALGEPSSNSIVEFLSEESCNVETRDFNGSFTFDRVFDMNCTQEDVFNYSFKQTVDDLMKGYNGTVFSYGQTGSGKSYTMMGPNNNVDDPEYCGVIPRIVDRIFEMILNSSTDMEYTVKVSYMEIYMERIRDLLNPPNDNLPIHEDKARGVYVKGLTEEYVSSSEEVYEVMRQGSRVRAVASTNMNQESSRSHSIFVITVAQKNTVSGTQKVGQLSLVDLAGSEKVGKTGASGQTLEEAKKINKSLSALGMVINSLTDGKSTHIPYRDSKLTRILQESLGGNSRTSLIVNCSPSPFNDSETLSTLRFGVRAKNIKNKAKINTELSPLELRQLLRKCQHQLESRVTYSNKLEVEITAWRAGDPPAKESWVPLGGPATTSLSVDTTRKSTHSTSASTSSIFSSPTTSFHSRNTSSISSFSRPTTPAPLRKNSAAGTPTPSYKRNSISDLSIASANDLKSKLNSSEASTPRVSVTPSEDPSLVDDGVGGSKRSSSGEVDTIEEFMRRENELNDQIAEKESFITEQEQLLLNLRTQIEAISQQQQAQSQSQKKNTGELNKLNTDLKLQIDNLNYEKKELSITADTLNDENKKLTKELQDAKRQILEFELNSRNSASSGRSRKLASVNNSSISVNKNSSDANDNFDGSNGLVGEKPVSISSNFSNTADSDISNSDGAEDKDDDGTFSDNVLSTEALREKKKQKKMSEILGQFYQRQFDESSILGIPSSRAASRNVSSASLLFPRPDSKEIRSYVDNLLQTQTTKFQEYIEASKESDDTKAELENIYEARLKASEETTRQLLDEITRLRSEGRSTSTVSNQSKNTSEDLNDNEHGNGEDVVPISAMKEKEEQAAAAQEQIETMQGHIAQYESLKASLMQDLQERCERVVELEISLDQAREQYNLAIRNSNNKQQQKKMTLLQRNLEQLTTIQRQLVEQNVALKRDVAMAHKILDARNERIQSLEVALRDSQNRLGQESEIFETKLTYLRDRLLEVKRGGPSASLASSEGGSSGSGFPLRERRDFNFLGPPISSPLGSPTSSKAPLFPTIPSHGANNIIVHYPDLSSQSSPTRTATRTVSGGPNSKIVKPLRGGGAGSTNNSNADVQTPIRQRANDLTRSATGLWTKLNSLVTNGGSAPGSPTRSPTRSPILKMYRGEQKNDNDSENKTEGNGDENKAETTFIAGIPASLSSSTSYGTSIDP